MTDDVKKLEKKFDDHLADHDRASTVLFAEISTKVQLDAQAALQHVDRVVAPMVDELRVLRKKTDAQTLTIDATLKETAKQTPILRRWLKGKKADRKERESRKAQDLVFRRWVKRAVFLIGAATAVVEFIRLLTH